MIDRDRLLYQPLFAALGRTAVYTPPAGDPVPCTVRWSEGDRDWPGLGTGVTASARIAKVRAAEVPEMEEGGTLTIGSEVHTIAKADRPDPDRLVWRLEFA